MLALQYQLLCNGTQAPTSWKIYHRVGLLRIPHSKIANFPSFTVRYKNWDGPSDFVNHPVHVKRSLVRCLYDRAKSIMHLQDGLQKEKRHLGAVLRNNGYSTILISRSSEPTPSQLSHQTRQIWRITFALDFSDKNA